MAQDRAGPEEDDVHATVVRGQRGGSPGQRPALVMAEGEQHAMPQQETRVLGDRDVGRVGHVKAMLLGEPDQRVLQLQEVS